MSKITGEIFTLFLSSVVVILFILFKTSAQVTQTTIALTLLILLVVIPRFLKSDFYGIHRHLKVFLLFLISLLTQLIVFSTGGFNSPFLLLLHLFAFGSGILVSLPVGLTFLIAAVSTLILGISFDPKLHTLFLDSPWTTVLYISSFFVVTPLSYLLVHTYHIRDSLINFLQLKLKAESARHHSVVQAVDDLIIITDTQFQILSFNRSSETFLKLSSSELLGRPLFEIISLKQLNGESLDLLSLKLTETFQQQGQSYEKIILSIPNQNFSTQTKLKIRPSTGLEGVVDQYTFIFSKQSSLSEGSPHQNIDTSYIKHLADEEEVKKILTTRGLSDIKSKVDLLSKTEKDIYISTEIQDHGVNIQPVPVDILQLLGYVIKREEDFARSLSVEVNYNFDNLGSTSFFTGIVDPEWFDLMVQKLLEISIMLASTSGKKVKVTQGYTENDITITFNPSTNSLSDQQKRLLFTEYYGELGYLTNLKVGSGLEGYIAKTIAVHLGIMLKVISAEDDTLMFNIVVSKQETSGAGNES